jgi:hypothetical protein
MILGVRPYIPEGHQEKLLLASIIRRAAYDIALYKTASSLSKRRLYSEAYAWMFHDDESKLHPDDRFTSFNNICMLLDQDPATIRRKSLKLTRKDVKKFDMVDTHGRV